ncbi:hypothetical protein [Psychroserpens sp. SPM9]|uniref:hypothetical protein n=1 Tax=Psychroserpens sp. SPM9 TaxID=2975598 RepID=UPI0021A8DD5E|nr:hypothetical protein [Psychroserpens sp. SPM9]MDG5492345.1 hypothetical protein [Psychroserpens sp. SPM9]
MMKKTLTALAIFMMIFNVQAQDTEEKDAGKDKMARMMELMAKEIAIEVDTTLYKSAGANTFVSEDPKSVIMAMMIPDSYENSKKKMTDNADVRFQITDKGETELNGVKVLYMKGISEAEGSTLDNEIYCMAVDDDTCLMFIGMVDQNADKKYAEAIEKAKNSVIKAK